MVCTDDAGESVELCGPTATGGGCFPLATNAVRLGEAGFDPPFAPANCTLNLNQPVRRPDRRGSLRRSIAQSWLVVLEGEDPASPDRAGQPGAGAPTALASACQLYNP